MCYLFYQENGSLGLDRGEKKKVKVFHVLRLMLMEQDAAQKYGYRVLLSVASSCVSSCLYLVSRYVYIPF